MKRILIIGAGLSSNSLISFLEKEAAEHQWQITVGDRDPELARSKVNLPTRTTGIDLHDDHQMDREVGEADLVISMLPARLHPIVARCCLKNKK